MTISFSLKKTDNRETCFISPEGEISNRWEIALTKESEELTDDYESDTPLSLTYTTCFTAYGKDSHTKAGAIASLKKLFFATDAAHTNYNHGLALAIEKSDDISLERPRDLNDTFNNETSDVNNELLSLFINLWTNGTRTAFKLDELGILDQYRYVLYGTRNLFNDMFDAKNSPSYTTTIDGRALEVSGFYIFEDLNELRTWVSAL
jgi:hypothetical protein